MRFLLISILTLGLFIPTTSTAQDYSCSKIEAFGKTKNFPNSRASKKLFSVSHEDVSIDAIDEVIEVTNVCIEERNEKLKSRSAVGGLLGGLAGAALSKDNKLSGAVAGAATGAILADSSDDKKIRRYSVALERLSAMQASLEEQIRLAQANQERETREQERQQQATLQAERQAQAGNSFIASTKLSLENIDSSVQGIKNLNDLLKECENKKYIRILSTLDTATSNNRGEGSEVCMQVLEARDSLYDSLVAEAVQSAVKENGDKVDAIGFRTAILNSKYDDWTLREYLSVVLAGDNSRIFKETHYISDVVVVVKIGSNPASKFYLEYDYGDLNPKAYEASNMFGVASGFKLVHGLTELPNFNSAYWSPFNTALRKLLNQS